MDGHRARLRSPPPRRAAPARRRARRRPSPPSRRAGAAAARRPGSRAARARGRSASSSPSRSPVSERPAEPRDRAVGLRQRHQEALRARGAADQHQQQAGGERVERAGVADLRAARQRAPHLGDHVVRGHPRRLGAEQDPGRGQLSASSCSRTCPRSCSTSSRYGSARGEAGRLRVAAAAELAGDARHVDAAVGGAQADLAHARRGRRRAARARARATAVPSTARMWSTTPSESVSCAPVCLVVVLDEVGDRDRAVVVALDARQRALEQLQAAEGQVLVEAAVDLVRLARPASISSAAMRCASGVVFSYMNLPGVGDEARCRARRRSAA